MFLHFKTVLVYFMFCFSLVVISVHSVLRVIVHYSCKLYMFPLCYLSVPIVRFAFLCQFIVLHCPSLSIFASKGLVIREEIPFCFFFPFQVHLYVYQTKDAVQGRLFFSILCILLYDTCL